MSANFLKDFENMIKELDQHAASMNEIFKGINPPSIFKFNQAYAAGRIVGFWTSELKHSPKDERFHRFAKAVFESLDMDYGTATLNKLLRPALREFWKNQA